MSLLRPSHQIRILNAYQTFISEAGFAQTSTRDEIARQDYSLSIPLDGKRTSHGGNGTMADQGTLPELWTSWEQEGREFWLEMDALVEMLDSLNESERSNS